MHGIVAEFLSRCDSFKAVLGFDKPNGGVSFTEKATGVDALEDRAVRIGDQIKRLDSYEIPIVLDNDLKTEIKLWVVSDKPVEEIHEEDEEEGNDEPKPKL